MVADCRGDELNNAVCGASDVIRSFTFGDLLAASAAFGTGLFFLWGSFGIEAEPGVLGGPQVFPQTAAIILMAFGLLIAAEALAHRRQDEATGKDRQSVLVFALVGGGLLYVWLIGAIGYLAATLVAGPFAFAAFGVTRPMRALGLGVLTALAIYAVFFAGLGIYDPPGRLFDIRTILP